MQADVFAYQAVKEAEGEKDAATKKADARLTLADAEQKAKALEAEGQTAVEMVPVNVDRERVQVERARVEVKREDLKNQAEFETIARELQVELARISAEKDAKIAAAEAMARAFASAKITVWGDPSSLDQMVQSFYAGQRNGFFVDGLIHGTPDNIKDAATNALSGLGTVGAALVKKLTGIDVEPKAVEDSLRSLEQTDTKPVSPNKTENPKNK